MPSRMGYSMCIGGDPIASRSQQSGSITPPTTTSHDLHHS